MPVLLIKGVSAQQVNKSSLHWRAVELTYDNDFSYGNIWVNKSITGCFFIFELNTFHIPAITSVLRCKEQIKLIRPEALADQWQQEQQRSGFVQLNIPEEGIHNIKAKIMSVKPVRSSLSKHDFLNIKSGYITGIFKRHSFDVKCYTFKNMKTGKISTINSTPFHRFYIENKNKFIPVNTITSTDKLITDVGEEIRASTPDKYSCATFSAQKKPLPVYNLEVYQRHVYYAGSDRILVHNVCSADKLKNASIKETAKFVLTYVNQNILHSGTRMKLQPEKYTQESIFSRNTIIALNTLKVQTSPIKNKYLLTATTALQTQHGNCEDMAIVGAYALKTHECPYEIDILGKGDHAFLRIGGYRPDAYIADPWAKDYFPYAQLRQRLHGINTDDSPMEVILLDPQCSLYLKPHTKKE